MRAIRGFFACVLVCATATIARAQWEPPLLWPVLYVAGGPGESGDGTTWATAYKTIQEALVYACPDPDPDVRYDLTICVKGGSNANSEIVYKPGTASSDTFLIVNRVFIAGGFEGASELEAPDPANHPTILSGDLGSSVYAEHVVTMTGSNSMLSGFVIEDGRALGSSNGNHHAGAGILVNGASPVIQECVIRDNLADNADDTGQAAGMYVLNGDPHIVGCTFERNDTYGSGGALFIVGGDPLIEGCGFATNWAKSTGGALYAYICDPVLSGCTFSANAADYRGGAVALYCAAPSCEITTTTFQDNVAVSGGGGLYVEDGSPRIHTNVGFDTNTAGEGGGALVVLDGNFASSIGPDFEDVDFISNLATGTGGAGAKVFSWLGEENESYDSTSFVACLFQGNEVSSVDALGAGLSIGGSTYVSGCTFEGNGCWDGGLPAEIQMNGGGAAVFNHNYRGTGPAGDQPPFSYNLHTAVFEDCVFRANTHRGTIAEGNGIDYILHGGGLYIQRTAERFPGDQTGFHAYCTPDADGACNLICNPAHCDTSAVHYDALLERCQFIDNLSANGGGLFLDRAAARLTDCDFMGNQADGNTKNNDTASYGGGAISTYRLSYVNLQDCRFVNNRVERSPALDLVDRSRSGGAIYVYLGMTMDFDRCWFVDNRATAADPTGQYGHGGALWTSQHCREAEHPLCGDQGFTATANVYNSLFVGNSAQNEGGAVYAQKGGITNLVNCTVMNNDAHETGGMLADSTSTASITDPCITNVYNSILWDNTDAAHDAGDVSAQLLDEVATWAAGPPEVYANWPTAARSCIQSGLANTPSLQVLQGPDDNIGDSGAEEPDIPVITTFGDQHWTTAADYSAVTGRTTFTKSNTTFTGLTNKILRTHDGDGMPAWSVIVEFDATHIVVLGNLSDFDALDEDFQIEDHLLAGLSPCIDAADEVYLLSPFNADDILGNPRIVVVLDIGCYEVQD